MEIKYSLTINNKKQLSKVRTLSGLPCSLATAKRNDGDTSKGEQYKYTVIDFKMASWGIQVQRLWFKCSGGNITIYGAAEEGELGDGNEICHGNGVNWAKYF